MTGPGGRPSISWPTSCAPRCAGAARAGRRPEAYRLAIALAELSFARGFPGESQRRYEQAAGIAPDAGQAAAALRWAAGAAKSRHFGNDALRLLQEAAEAAVRAGDRAGAARTWPRRPRCTAARWG